MEDHILPQQPARSTGQSVDLWDRIGRGNQGRRVSTRTRSEGPLGGRRLGIGRHRAGIATRLANNTAARGRVARSKVTTWVRPRDVSCR